MHLGADRNNLPQTTRKRRTEWEEEIRSRIRSDFFLGGGFYPSYQRRFQRIIVKLAGRLLADASADYTRRAHRVSVNS